LVLQRQNAKISQLSYKTTPYRYYSTKKQDGLKGPEPKYDRIVAGFETFHHRTIFSTELKEELPEYKIAYETWGKLSPTKENVILLHTGLSASSHARSHEKNKEPGWWEKFVGPGLAIDTDKQVNSSSKLLTYKLDSLSFVQIY
jgi:homoserine acetyltransferase